jgi:hypothetical protein
MLYNELLKVMLEYVKFCGFETILIYKHFK